MALRTVGVKLTAEVSDYMRNVDQAKKGTKDLTGKLDEAARAGDRTAVAADHAGDKLADMARDARRLDLDIKRTTSDMRDLAREIVRTSDAAKRAELQKKLTGKRGELRDMVDLRKLIDVDSATGLGADMAGKVSMSFAQRLGPLIARAPMAGMNPAALAIGAPLAAGVATLLGTAAGGAIIGGVGIGGVVGGLALAAKDSRVQAAGTELGEELSAMMGRSAGAFVPATLDAIDTIRDRALGMEGDFTRLFSRAATYVDPLVDGLLDAADNAMPGLIDAMDAAGPVVDVVADGLRDIGQAIGDGLSDLAPYADEGARALGVLFMVLEGGIRVVFDAVENMSRLYKVAELVGAVLAHDIPRALTLAAGFKDVESSSTDLTGSLDPLKDRIRDVASEEEKAEAAAKKLKDAFDELFGIEMSLDRATIAYKEGIRDLAKELTNGKRTLDTDTQAGRDNATAVLDQVEKIKTLRQARIDHGMTLDAADGKYKKDIEGLRKTMLQAGYTTGEVDALLGKYKAIPDEVNTAVNLDDKASAKARAIRAEIRKINGRTVVVAVKFETHGSIQGEHIIGQGTKLKGLSAGGPVEDAPGPKGVDSRLYALARGEHVLTAAEVDAAGGHAAIERWRAELRAGQGAGGWAAAAPMMASPVMAGGGTMRLEVVARVEGAGSGLMREISRGIRLEVKNVGGGSVQATYGRSG